MPPYARHFLFRVTLLRLKTFNLICLERNKICCQRQKGIFLSGNEISVRFGLLDFSSGHLLCLEELLKIQSMQSPRRHHHCDPSKIAQSSYFSGYITVLKGKLRPPLAILARLSCPSLLPRAVLLFFLDGELP